MSEVKYVHLEAGDFLADPDFQMMTDAERGIYCSVIFYMYCNNGRIVDDAESIKRLCNAGNGFDKNWNRLRPKFRKKGKYLTHKRVRKELARAQKYIQNKRRAGLMGAESRWQADGCANDDANGTLDGKPMAKQNKGKQHKIKQTKESKGCFAPPSPQEVSAYAKEKGFQIDGNQFCDFYESKGWMIGKNKMKSWRAAVGTWCRREQKVEEKDDGLCVVDKKPGVKFCLNNGKKVWLCEDCLKAWGKTSWGAWSYGVIETRVLAGKAKGA